MVDYSMRKCILIFVFIFSTIFVGYGQKNNKFTQEITIDCEDIRSAKMSSNETIYGNAKDIDVTFPFKTFINPQKGAEIKLKVVGYEEYRLVIPPDDVESYFMVSFTVNQKEMAKLNKIKGVAKEKNSSSKEDDKEKGTPMEITINCSQFKSAKMTKAMSVGKLIMFGALGALVHNQKHSKDITFPFTTTIDVDKANKLLFYVPGYNVYELHVPKGNIETNFDIYFTENPKEMAKLEKESMKVSKKSPMQAQTNPKAETVEIRTSKPSPDQVIIRWMIDSDPQGARIFYRVISSIPDEVKNTNESYMLTTPFEETRAFNILGLTYENSMNVQVEIKLMKSGYYSQVKRFNLRQALDQQEISAFFNLVPKEETEQ